jgi:hypothetical protein
VGSPEVQRIGEPLVARGLLRRPAAIRAAWRARRLVVLALVATVVLGAVATAQWLSGPDPSEHTPPVFAFGAVAVVAGLHLLVGRPPREPITPAGRRQLQLVRGSGPWRPREVAPEHAAAVGAFALDGAAALTAEDHLLREAFGGTVDGPVRLTKAGSRSARSGSGSTGGSGGNASCGAIAYACGSSTGHSGHSGHSGGHSGGSGHSDGHSGGSSHSCGGSSHSCGSSSSCGGSSCGGGGCGS